MGYRRFTDREGQTWEIRTVSRAEWEFHPVTVTGPARVAAAPGYEADPFELSIEELQRLLDSAPPPAARKKSAPFKDG